MPIFLVNQAFSLLGPFKCLRFLKYALKGTGNLLLMCFCFFLVSMCLEWLGRHFPSLLSRSLVPSVPIKGFIRNKKKEFYGQLHRCGTCFAESFCQLDSRWFLGCGPSQPPALGWVDCGFGPGSQASNSSMEEKGMGLEEKPLSGRDASNFYNIPHLQYIEFLQNNV